MWFKFYLKLDKIKRIYIRTLKWGKQMYHFHIENTCKYNLNLRKYEDLYETFPNDILIYVYQTLSLPHNFVNVSPRNASILLTIKCYVIL